jgi:gluconate kinase
MVIVIMGTAVSDRNSVGRLLADTLGWEYVDEQSLHNVVGVKAINNDSTLGEADWTMPLEPLCSALQCWNFQWRDVVVACSMLTERDRRELCDKYPSVRFVYLKSSQYKDQITNSAQPLTHRNSAISRDSAPGPKEKILTVDPSHRAEQIVAEVISVHILNRRGPHVAAA